MDMARERTSTFDRLFNAASRARQELASQSPDGLLSATRRLFRRRPVMQRSHGRRPNPVWHVKLFLLPGPDFETLPSTAGLQQFVIDGLGRPSHESGVDGENSKIDLNWTLSDLNSFICQCYPRMSLNLIGFELARAGKGRKLQKLQAGSVKELRKGVGKSRLYILPRAEIRSATGIPQALLASASDNETLQMSDNVEVHQDLLQPPVMPESSFLPIYETTTVADQSELASTIQESRRIRFQQDEEYHTSLLEDQQKEMRKCALATIEERRRMAIKERCQRMADRTEPSDGICLKFKYPDGSTKIGKFNELDPVQVLFDFVGQDEAASEVFKVQDAGCNTVIDSTSGGLVLHHKIETNTTFYVLWMSVMDVEEWISHQKDVDQQQLTLQSTELFSIADAPPTSSPLPKLTEDPDQSSQLIYTPIIIDDDEVNALSPGLQPLETWSFVPVEAVNEGDLQTVLAKLLNGVDCNLCPTSNQINVCRSNILQCSLQAFQRRRFNPGAKLDVVFVDEDMNAEGSVDEGGPTREFLRLLMRAIHNCSIFEGHEKDRQLALNMEALDTKMYMWVAKMISVCVVHGGVGPHFFSDRLYQQICGLPTSPVRVEDIGDHKLREQLIKIQEAATIEEANIATEEAADSLSILGSLRRVTKIEDKDSLVLATVEFFMNGRIRDAIDQ